MSPSSLGSPASHAYVQFLNSVLSQRGPSALPYEENFKLTIRSHLVSLLDEFPSLQVKTETFTHNDGEASNLLQVGGTIPMYYLEVIYNIPVTVWISEDYPKKPPLVFVTPTSNMLIKQPHRHVDPSGSVSVPYLLSWVYPRSNLVELVRSLSLVFGQDPPLYSTPVPSFQNPHGHNSGATIGHTPLASSAATSSLVPGSMMQPRANMNVAHGVGRYPSSSQIPSTSPYGGAPSSLSSHHPYPPYRHPTSSTSSNQAPNLSDPSSHGLRHSAIHILTERVQRDMAEIQKAKEMEMDKLASTQGLLRQRKEACMKGLQGLQQEKEGLEQRLQTILTNTDVLETWLKENKRNETDVDIDNAFEPSDALSKQLLECTSADLAIEDVLYGLDKAVQEAAVPVDAYMKHVRTFSREQFFHRATAVKVKAAQAQLQVTAIADRGGAYS